MSTIFEPNLRLSQFKLPPQDIDILSFCGSNKIVKLKAWVDALKITQINQTTVTLYNTVPEIAHLKTPVSNRYGMLEILWPIVQQCLQVFSKEYLQQPLMLPPKAQKAAIISQALQKHLLDGYTICIKELVTQKKLKSDQKELLLNSLYRAMQALSRLMLRSYQLYNPIPPSMWLRAHTLLQTAEYYGLQNEIIRVSTNEGSSQSLLHMYLQIIAMGCIRPNQLSQNDLYYTHSALGQWSKHISLYPSATQDDCNLYTINLSKDSGPFEKIRGNDNDHDRILEMDFQSLVKQIISLNGATEITDNHRGATLTIPQQMPATLIQHILDCWCHCSERKLARKSIEIKAEACVGIIDCHYHISGKIDFNSFLNPSPSEDEDASFLSSSFDQLVSSLSGNNEIISKSPEDKQTTFETSIQNISSGGYCLQWNDKPPSRTEAGELIGIRETGRRAWSIGIIRWIRQTKTTSQMGVQILCNQPVPYGASVTLDNGLESDYMRVIHIPSPNMPDQPPSLLTTMIPFQEGRRAELKQDDHITSVRLGKSIYSTSKLNLFSFETLAQDTQESNDY